MKIWHGDKEKVLRRNNVKTKQTVIRTSIGGYEGLERYLEKGWTVKMVNPIGTEHTMKLEYILEMKED